MNLILPATSTSVETVMMAARAAILPDGVSTVTSRPFQAMWLAGVDSASGKLLAEPRHQRAQALAAADRIGAVLRMRLVDRGNILQILAGGIGAEHEFRRRGPVAEIFRQRGGAWHIGLAARGVVDGAVGADENCEKFLGFAGSRVATADANLPTQRRHGDVEPGIARELDHRVGVGIVQPARATIERRVEGRAVGKAAAAARATASITITLRFAAMIRRAAAIRRRRRRSRQYRPRAAMACPRRDRQAPALPQSPRTPTENRGASMSCHGFRNFEKDKKLPIRRFKT